jgi:hypothetical protein
MRLGRSCAVSPDAGQALKAAYVPPECLGGALAFRLRHLSTNVRAYGAITVPLAPLSTKPFGVAKPIPRHGHLSLQLGHDRHSQGRSERQHSAWLSSQRLMFATVSW